MTYYPKRYYPAFPPTPRRPDYPPYEPEYPPLPEEGKKSGDFVVNKRYKYYGIALCLLSVASLGVEIANVVFTYINFNVGNPTVVPNALAVPYILTWIAAGIWGSIPVFITGVLAIRVAGTYKKQVRVFALFCSLSAVVFTPAMIGLSVAEIIVYPASTFRLQPWYLDQPCYFFNNSRSLSCPKFVLPLTVASLGGIEFYLTLMVTIIFCFCYRKSPGEPNEATKTISSSPARVQPAYSPYPGVVQIRQEPYYGRLPPNGERQPQESAGADPETHVVLLPSRGIPISDMGFLHSYPISRPSTSRGFGVASAYNHGLTYGNLPGATSASPFYGSIPSLAAFGAPGPNPAYKIVPSISERFDYYLP